MLQSPSPGRAFPRARAAAALAALAAAAIPAAAAASGHEDTSVPASEPSTTGSGTAAAAEQEEPASATRKGADEGRARVRVADTTTRKAFFDARRRARFEFEIGGQSRRDIVVKAFKVSSGEMKQRWKLEDVEPGRRRAVRWNGRQRKGGYTGQGKHVFKVYELGGEKADMSDAEGRKRFRFFKHRFPVRGRHTYGDGFGAGRGHKGQDVFAKCGKKVVAARGGRIQTREYHSSAGYYMVIDGRKTKRDYVYMHLQKRGRPAKGARVRTGEVIGYNGQTGNASGCHLHFELWSKPGWYEGGSAQPPTRLLKKWDGWS